MKLVTEKICKAFIQGEKKTIGNSQSTGNELLLFGNKIAERKDGRLYIYDGGYYVDGKRLMSRTTKERLNGLLKLLDMDAVIYQEKKVNYIASGYYAGKYWTHAPWEYGCEIIPALKEVVPL